MRIKQWLGYGVTAVAFTALGMTLANTDAGEVVRYSTDKVKKSVLSTVAATVSDEDTRMQVLLENPSLIKRVTNGFGGEFLP